MHALLLSVLLTSTPAQAQEEEAPRPEGVVARVAAPGPVHIAIATSGGGSLGAYQAGYLYYVLQTARQNPDIWQVEVVSGTSAGAINSLVGALTVCSPAEPDPTESLFYRTWMPVSLQGLFDPDTATAGSFLDRKGFDGVIGRLRERYETGLEPGCQVWYGASVSRLEPRRVDLGGGFTAPVAREHLVVSLQTGESGAPTLTPWVPPTPAYPEPALPVADPDADGFGHLADAILASSGFPLAFAPKEVATCLVPRGGDPTTCTEQTAARDRYVDGGLYDNVPLRVADVLSHRVGSGEQTVIIYLDARLGRFPEPPWGEVGEIVHTSDLVGALVSGVVDVAGTAPVVTLLEEDPEVLDRLAVAEAWAPQMSRELSAFFGLFQREIREYDFYLGMYSAHREIRDRSASFRLRELKLPEEHPDAPRAGWATFRCLEAMYEGGEDTGACIDPAAARLAPVMQVSAERLYAWCAGNPEGTATGGPPSEHCKAARQGESPPVVPGMGFDVDGWRLREGEQPLGHTLRRLAHHGFAFTDLGVDEPSEPRSRKAVRRTLRRLVRALARNNPGQGLLVSLVGNQWVKGAVPPPVKP